MNTYHGPARRMLDRRQFGQRMLASTLGAAAFTQALAQSGPFTKPVRIISPYAAGIGPDAAMRILAEKLSLLIGQQIVVDPRPGGNGIIALNALKQAPNDGHTFLLVGNAHLTINPHLFKSPEYQVEGVIEPVSTIYRAPFFIGVPVKGPHKSLEQLVAAAKAAPERVTYSVPYMGSPPHLGGVLLGHLTGAKLLPVAYKDAQVTAVAAGEVDFTMATLGSFQAMVKAGRLQLLAITQPTRLASAPDIPTVEEAGGPKEMTVQSWTALVTRHGAPADFVRRMSEDMRRALATPNVIERFDSAGLVASANTPTQLAGLLRDDGRFYGDLIKRIGMKSE